jgi:flagellar hook assembly protein FlgD
VLYQNYPNPFNPYTIIRFALTTSAYVRITIYDVLGREIDRLLDTEINDGYHEVTWNPKVASGVYLYRIEIVPLIGSVKPFSVVHKMLYMK